MGFLIKIWISLLSNKCLNQLNKKEEEEGYSMLDKKLTVFI